MGWLVMGEERMPWSETSPLKERVRFIRDY